MKRFWQWLGTALLVAIFLSLANWQWNRADELKNPPKIDQTILPIDSLISPSQSITQEQVGRRVEVEGMFISNWILPNQKVSTKNIGDKKVNNPTSFDVGLFQTKDNAAILVLRGIHKDQSSDSTIDLMVKKKVVGYLLPQQSEDVANTHGDEIARIDSALFVTKTQLPLYAPYIHAISENPTSGYQTISFNVLDMGSDVPGYYWQHISYVVIWFLFALTAIYLMVYQRRLDKVKP